MKKIFALALALMMVLALAACGGGSDTPDPSGSGTSQQEQPSNPSGNGGEQQPSSTPDEGENTQTPDEAGVSWPENDYTEQVPTLPDSILACCTETYDSESRGNFSFYYYDTTPPLEALQGYVTALEEAGFTGNESVNTTEIDNFNYSASNAEGYSIVLTHDYFTITKPQ